MQRKRTCRRRDGRVEVNPNLFAEVEGLLQALQDRERLERHRLAHQLVPLLQERYGDLKDAPFPALMVQGLTRLWQEVAGSEPLALIRLQRLERYFALMVWYLYPAQRGRHRFLISSDRQVGPINSFSDPAVRLGEPEYLALIYANGDLVRAHQALEQYGEVFKALSETRADGHAVHPHPNTVNSRRKAGIRLLAARIADLLRTEAAGGQQPAKGLEDALWCGQPAEGLTRTADEALQEGGGHRPEANWPENSDNLWPSPGKRGC